MFSKEHWFILIWEIIEERKAVGENCCSTKLATICALDVPLVCQHLCGNDWATKGRPSILDLLLSKNKKFFYSACNIFALFVHLYYDGR